MAKSVHDDVLDAALDKIATCTRLVVCSTAPANFAGIAAVARAEVYVPHPVTGKPFIAPGTNDIAMTKVKRPVRVLLRWDKP